MRPPGDPDLYRQLLGDAWLSLAEAIRLAHATDIEREGTFTVSRGNSLLVRMVLMGSRLPSSGSEIPTRLKITRKNRIEIWARSFGEEQFTTHQWASPTGHLVERFGLWELHFALRSERPDSLSYVQKRTRLHLGALSVPVPMMFAPLISATETAEGAARVHVRVAIRLPVIGPIINYDGHLGVGGLPS